jgi:hypothetical protein
MTNLKEGDIFKLDETLKNAARTDYEYAKVTKITLMHQLGSFQIEATLQDKPIDSKPIIPNAEFNGNTYVFSIPDIHY